MRSTTTKRQAPTEKYLGEYFTKLIYATFDDIARDWNGQIVYDPYAFQSYSNLIKDKRSRVTRLKSIFTVSAQVRQYLAFLFESLVNELASIDIPSTSTLLDITRDLAAQYDSESYTVFMFGVSSEIVGKFGKTLKSATEPTQTIYSRMLAGIPSITTVKVVNAPVFFAFENFLKGAAWMIARLIWHTRNTVSDDLFIGIISQLNMAQPMIDVMQSSLRQKPPSKQKKTVDENGNKIVKAAGAKKVKVPTVTTTGTITGATAVTTTGTITGTNDGKMPDTAIAQPNAPAVTKGAILISSKDIYDDDMFKEDDDFEDDPEDDE